MKTVTAHLDDSNGLRFRVTSGSGHEIVADDVEGDGGPRPTELLLMALAGCTAMDVISILRKKRQAVDRYEVEVSGTQRADHPAVFEQIDVLHVVAGQVEREAVRRAVELSATRYCSVGATLSSGVTQLRHAFRLTGPHGIVDEDQVCITGPHEPVDRPAELVAAG
jgi:putative redox protein